MSLLPANPYSRVGNPVVMATSVPCTTFHPMTEIKFYWLFSKLEALLMVRLLVVVLAIALSLPAAAQIVDVPKDDQVMIAAIEKAKTSLGAFWERYSRKAADEKDYSVKLAIPISNGRHEHIWALVNSKSGDQVTATITSEPRDATTVKKGERVTVPVSTISDWLYWRNGKLYGAYTLRAVLERMTPQDADRWRAQLAPE